MQGPPCVVSRAGLVGMQPWGRSAAPRGRFRAVPTVYDITTEELTSLNIEIQELVAERLPMMFAQEFTWSLWATSLLARSASIVDSITALIERDRRADADVTLRTLFEHITTLCWLAIDPDSHLKEWQEGSEFRWRQFNDEAAEHFGKGAIDPSTATELEGRKLRSLEQRSEEVSDYWPNHISAFKRHAVGSPDSILSFRGIYTAIYRTASRLAHAEVDSLQANVWERPNLLLLVTTKERPRFGRAALAFPLFAFGLLVYNEHFNWPGEPRTSRMVAALNHGTGQDEATC